MGIRTVIIPTIMVLTVVYLVVRVVVTTIIMEEEEDYSKTPAPAITPATPVGYSEANNNRTTLPTHAQTQACSEETRIIPIAPLCSEEIPTRTLEEQEDSLEAADSVVTTRTTKTMEEACLVRTIVVPFS